MSKITETVETKERRLFGLIPMWRTQNYTKTTVERSKDQSTKNPPHIIPPRAAYARVDDSNTPQLQVAPSDAGQNVAQPQVASLEQGTKGDRYTKEMIQRILDEGCLDKWPSSKYGDGVPAHTLSVNHAMMTYDFSKGEMPLITLRPIAVKYAIGELLWIYQDQSNNLDLLKEKYGITWWDEWDLGDRTIGTVYGETIRRHRLVQELLDDIKNNPDGRRHIINMWQVDDFAEPHGLKPCAYQTAWNVRHGKDGVDYLDMCLYQRSSDFMAAGCINQVQYSVFLHLIARHCGYAPGRFTWFVQNIQIYDRHIDAAKEMLARDPVACQPEIWLNPDKKDFFDFTVDDIKIKGYPRQDIAAKNPQLRFDLGHENVDTEGFDLKEFLSE